MKTSVKLTDFLNIRNCKEYKIHLACYNGKSEPLDLFYNDYEAWVGWNEYIGKKNDFNRRYILTLIKDYSQANSYIFAGIFRVVDRVLGKKYVLEEVSDYEQYKGNLYITFKRYHGLRGRAFRLETLSDKLRITEIVEEQSKSSDIKEFEKPNLFHFATSELCQDAMFSWLIQWADDSYNTVDKQICLLGKSFLNRLTGIAIDEIKTVSNK